MNNIKFDFVTNTITVARGFYEEACKYGTEEYGVLQQIKADNPEMKIVIRTVATGNRKSATKGLTYKYMRKFISVMDKDNLSKFNEIMLYYEGFGLDNTTVYQRVKDWFVETYPHHKEMIVAAAPSQVIVSVPKVAA